MNPAIYVRRSLGYDEMFDPQGTPRPSSVQFVTRLKRFSETDLRQRQESAEHNLHNLGITFTVYGHHEGTEKVWPFDLLPRIIDSDEWSRVELGLKQRMRALNLFVADVYNDRKILKDRVVPEDLILSSKALRPQMLGFHPPEDVWCHISGVDLVRDQDGTIYVLEDNLRCPSGVSYVLENRELMKRTLPQVFEGMSVTPVEDYPERLLDTLISLRPATREEPTAVLLTPGIYNSAYYEHTYLAQQMGIELVQGSDLVVRNGYVHMCTTQGLRRVDVIYRRIDDEFLDPRVFRPDSALGVAGLMEVYRAGRVTLANAPGSGVADDKAVYAYVPEIIRYYLGEEPLLSNVPTYVCSDPRHRAHVLSNLDKLVVKPHERIRRLWHPDGATASRRNAHQCADLIVPTLATYIAQPMLQLSTVPTLVGDEVQPRHVDLRPFVLYGQDIFVMPGGLTRVALREGSMIVNSSQGGGSKDTWVLRDTWGPHVGDRIPTTIL